MSTDKNYILQSTYIEYLYILTTKDNTMFKVGITTDPRKRIKNINKHIEIELDKSFIVPCFAIGEASIIERDIKKEFKEFRKKGLVKFDGSTEFYKIEVFSQIFSKIYSKTLEKRMIKIKKLERLPTKLFNDLEDKEEKKNIFFKKLSPLSF